MSKNGKSQLRLGSITCRAAIDAAERYNRLLEILLGIAGSDSKDFTRKNSTNLEIVNKNKTNSKTKWQRRNHVSS